MKFDKVLTPDKERIRALQDCRIDGTPLRRGQVAEVSSAEAQRGVRLRYLKYATRIELLKPVGPIGEEHSVEPGVGSVVEVSSHQAREMERDGTGRPAPSLDGKPRFPLDSGPMQRLRVDAPKRPRPDVGRDYAPGLFVAPLSRWCANGDIIELPAELAKPYVESQLAVPVE